MKLIIIIFLIALFFALLDFFSFKAINSSFQDILSKNLMAKILFFSTTGITVLFLAYAFIKADTQQDIYTANYFYTVLGLIVLFYLPKLNISIFYGLESLAFLLSKKHFYINNIGLILSAITFLLVAHGMWINKTNFQVREQQIVSTRIPNSFNNFKIIQISDLHIGSFHNDLKSIEKLVKQINAENPDLIVFTGDMISNYAEEMDEFIPILSELSAKYGKYAILGNHDYGEYVRWKSKEEEVGNLVKLKENHEKIGFKVLDNKCNKIIIDGQTIQLAGVENWGLPPFPQYGNIKESTPNLDSSNYTILLSHDPSHWRAEVLKQHPYIDLTLSGHTHAMQFGFEIGPWQYSPVMYKYKEWAGLYQETKQYLYVNRGTGYIGFPGRVGIRPEITKLVLMSD